jgi:hypothetical protein
MSIMGVVCAACPQMVEAFEGGEFAGDALGDVLAGRVSPSGVLPFSVFRGAAVVLAARLACVRSAIVITGQALASAGLHQPRVHSRADTSQRGTRQR